MTVVHVGLHAPGEYVGLYFLGSIFDRQRDNGALEIAGAGDFFLGCVVSTCCSLWWPSLVYPQKVRCLSVKFPRFSIANVTESASSAHISGGKIGSDGHGIGSRSE